MIDNRTTSSYSSSPGTETTSSSIRQTPVTLFVSLTVYAVQTQALIKAAGANQHITSHASAAHSISVHKTYTNVTHRGTLSDTWLLLLSTLAAAQVFPGEALF